MIRSMAQLERKYTMDDSKRWFESKTLWVNILAGAAALASALGYDFFGVELQAELVVGILAVVGIVLRVVTDKPIV